MSDVKADSFLLRFKDQDTPTGISAESFDKLVKHIGKSKTDVMHMALVKMMEKWLPNDYEANCIADAVPKALDELDIKNLLRDTVNLYFPQLLAQRGGDVSIYGYGGRFDSPGGGFIKFVIDETHAERVYVTVKFADTIKRNLLERYASWNHSAFNGAVKPSGSTYGSRGAHLNSDNSLSFEILFHTTYR